MDESKPAVGSAHQHSLHFHSAYNCLPGPHTHWALALCPLHARLAKLAWLLP